MPALSLDLRNRIVEVYDQGELTQKQVAERFCVSPVTVQKLLRQRRETGSIASRYDNCGRKPKILDSHRNELMTLIREDPGITLAEMRDHLGLDCSLPAIHYVLKKMGVTYKKSLSSHPSRVAKM